jgi:hypothetical protein
MSRPKRNLYFFASIAMAVIAAGLVSWHGFNRVPASQAHAQINPGYREISTEDRLVTLASDSSTKASNDLASRNSDNNNRPTITIKFRAVSLCGPTGHPEADKQIAYEVLDEIRNSDVFDPDPQQTKVLESPSATQEPGTYSWSVVARLNRPIKTY